ncbi:MAG: hypothetical protein ACJ72E_14915 [Marmoricola sp.]
MSKMKLLARMGAAAILATGVFAGIPGPANAATDGHLHHRSPVSTVTDSGQSTGTAGGFSTNSLADTGWG